MEQLGLLIERISETIKNEAKEQKGKFLSVLLGTLAASMLRSALTGRDQMKHGKTAKVSYIHFLRKA